MAPQSAVKLRLLAFGAVVTVAFITLAVQLWSMQVLNGSNYLVRAENNRLRIVPIPAPRGVIYDRTGAQLVANIPSFSIGLSGPDLPSDPAARGEVLGQLSGMIGMPVDEMEQRLREARARGETTTPVSVMTNAPKETALSIEENAFRMPGVRVQADAMRQYQDGNALASILGYMGRIAAPEYDRLKDEGYSLNDRLGKTGVEFVAEEALRGRFGRETVEFDADGDKVQTLGREEPVPGNSVVLTIDAQLQAKMKEALEKTKGKSEQSVGIAMDVRTGEVLAMVSLPTYDNNIFSRPIVQADLQKLINDPTRPLINHAISSAFPPGSIFKPIVGAAALQEQIATPSTTITSRGSITVGNQFDPSAPGYVFKDWRALGTLDFRGGLAMSSDVYYYYLAGGFKEPDRDFKGLGATRISNYAKNFGLGKPTGINLPGEASGQVSSPDLKMKTFGEQWLLGDTYNFGIGQGFLTATPLQMLNSAAAIANGGTLWEPQIIKEIRDPEGKVVQPYQRQALSTVEISAENLQIVREGMRQTVTNGTATILKAAGVDSAGKTGTAEFTERDPETGYGKTHAWYMGYAPYDNPEIAVIVFHQTGGGSDTSAPAALEFLQFWAEYRKTQPRLVSAP